MTLLGCQHHWLLDSRNAGVCRECGASRQFPFDLEEQMQPWRQSSQRNAVRESRKAAERARDAQKTTMVWRD